MMEFFSLFFQLQEEEKNAFLLGRRLFPVPLFCKYESWTSQELPIICLIICLFIIGSITGEIKQF